MTEFEDQVAKLGLQQLAQINPSVKEILEHNYALSVAAVHALIVELDRRLTVMDGKVVGVQAEMNVRLGRAWETFQKLEGKVGHLDEKFTSLEMKVECLQAELMAISNVEGGHEEQS